MNTETAATTLLHRPRVSLVQVRMTGENQVGPDAGGRARVVDVAQHAGAGDVVDAPGERRVMDRED